MTGVNLILAPNFVSQLSSMHMLSPDGKSHSFDSRANGYARGEAIAAVIVKPLQRALADGDTIRAVIRGSGANQDGKTVGITIPNGKAQAELIQKTYAIAGLPLDRTGYFEAHGTGTPVGDPIELSAIGSSFGKQRDQGNPLIVGSVKPNIGHTEGAAGLAGVVKSVLALEAGIIPPLADFQELNERLRLEEWNLALPLKPTPWPAPGLRRASVNSFGFGGANAHVILDDAYHYLKSHGLVGIHQTRLIDNDNSSDSGVETDSASSDTGDSQHNKLFLFSAYDGAGIKRTEASWKDFLADHLANSKGGQDSTSVNDLAYTLSKRRTIFDFRSFAVAPSLRELSTKIEGGLPRFKRTSRRPNAAFVFTGQGAQWPAMGRELLSNAVFRASVGRSNAILEREGCKWDVVDVLSDPNDRRIDAPEFAQPICTVVQVALVDLLESWGVQPGATVGHSSGEVAAAYAARLLSQDDAVRIGYWRGFYSEQVKDRLGDQRGSMMAVGLSEAKADTYLSQAPPGSVVIACVNSPSSVTFSGEESAIDTLEKIIQGDGHFARKLRVQVAYHSPHMKAVADEFLSAVGTIEPRSSDVPMFSSVTETRVAEPGTLVASYWMQNLISPVRFSGALTNLLNYTPGGKARPHRRRPGATLWSTLVEVGPHEALKGPCRQIMSAWDTKAADQISYLSLLSRGKHAVETALTAAGLLWASGHPISTDEVNQYRSGAQKVVPDLPPYPWNHEKGFWHEPAASVSARLRKQPRTELLGIPLAHQPPSEQSWQNYLSVAECPWQTDHVITGAVLYPGAGHLIMAFEAAQRLATGDRALKGVSFSDVHFDKGLVIPLDDQTVETRLVTRPHGQLQDWYHYTLYSVDAGGSWTKHSWGTMSLQYSDAVSANQRKRYQEEYENLRNHASQPLDIPAFYDQLRLIGTEYGSTFRNLTEAAVVPGEHTGVGTISIPDTKSVMPHEFEYPHLIHPATLDAIFHLIFVAMGEGNALAETAIPTAVDRIFISTDLPRGVGATYTGFSHAGARSGRDSTGSIVVSDGDWSAGPKIVVERMVVTEVSSGASGPSNPLLTPGGQGRIATLEWKEDVDALVGPAAEAWLGQLATSSSDAGIGSCEAAGRLDAWLALACFKDTDLRTLFIQPSGWEGSLDLLKKHGTKDMARYRFRQTVVVESTENEAQEVQDILAENGIAASCSALDLSIVSNEAISQLGTFDIIIADSTSAPGLSVLVTLLNQDGRLAIIQRRGHFEDHSLSEGGLEGIVAFKSTQDSSSISISGLASSQRDPVIAGLSEIVLLRHADAAPATKALEEQLTVQLTSLGPSVRSTTLADAGDVSGKTVISLLEADRPFVVSWTAEEFEQFRHITRASYLLWITRGGLLAAGEASLDYAPSTGLLRTVRVEKPQIKLPHLDLSQDLDLSSSKAVELTLSALRSSIKESAKEKNLEMEYAEANGLLYVPRAQGHVALDHELALCAGAVTEIQGTLYQPGVGRRLEASHPGDVSKLRWVPAEQLQSNLADREVEVQVSHVGLEHSKVRAFLSDKGRSSSPQLARLVVGTITQVGGRVSRLIPGDQVVALHQTPFHTHLRVSETLVRKVPVSQSQATASHLPVIAAYAWHTLVDIAGFRARQKVFVNGASGSLGGLIVQLAQLLKGEVFASVNSETEQETLRETYNLPASHVLRIPHSAAWSADIEAATGGGKLDIVINTADADAAIRRLCTSIADGGRFVDVTQQLDPLLLDPKLFQRNVGLFFLDLNSIPDDQLLALVDKSLDLIRTGVLDSNHNESTVYSVSDFSEALVHASRSQQDVVVELSPTATVPVLPPPLAPLQLKADGTYILAGGLGALGLTIADNLCTHGARHLVFLSRSGATNQRQQEALQSFRVRGCEVDVFKCDVTDKQQVQAIAAEIREKSWNVRGVVQLAMVLRVCNICPIYKYVAATDICITGLHIREHDV